MFYPGESRELAHNLAQLLGAAAHDAPERAVLRVKDQGMGIASSDIKRINYKFRWIDREGMRAWEEETWKPLLMYENSNIPVTTVAPTNKAVDFRLILLSQE